MRDDRQGELAKTGTQTKTVRFGSVVATAGKPEVYLPLLDPKQDRSFMRAVREERVLSIRQEPTSTRTDFGAVGFDEHKYTTYLVFPKPLTAFANARILGIKYDVVGGSPVVASTSPRFAKKAKRNVLKRAATLSRQPARKAEPKRRQPPKPAPPQPKEFRVRLRITTVTEKDVTVKAMTKNEAKNAAQTSVWRDGVVRVVRVAEVKH